MQPDLKTLRHYEQLLSYELACMDAAEHLLDFAKFTMPHPRHLNDPTKSLYLPARHHEIMADLMESMERGEIKKAICSVPVRHGKTELCTKRFNAWFAGRHPEMEIMTATYGEKFARDFRSEVKAIMGSQRFRQAFPDVWISKESPDQLVNNFGKNLFFLGRRSPTTGRGGNFLIVDDPIKDDAEARYIAYRDDVWEWFTRTLISRRHNDKAPILLMGSRWHEDDPMGRILDKTNPCYSARFSEGWELVNLPAIAEDDDQMGRKPGDPLWPERFGTAYLEEMQAASPVSFSALYQGNPTPAEGIFFLQDDIHTYSRADLERVEPELRMYAASDHAVATDAHNDPTCMGPYGVAADGTTYILPDLVWRRLTSDQSVEEMLNIIRRRHPIWWYAEKGHISQSIGPFLKKRMQEEGLHCPIVEDHPSKDAVTRAQSARARMATCKLLIPDFAPWSERAKAELLKFPNGRHDDFVAFLSIVGMKVMTSFAGRAVQKTSAPKPGTWGALKAEFAEQDRSRLRRDVGAGW